MKQLIEALIIFSKYTDEDYPTSCDHDILYVNVSIHEVSEEDKVKLESLGFYVDESLEIFCSRKYGSC